MTTTEFLEKFAPIARKFKWTLEDGKIRAPYYKSKVCPAVAYYEILQDLKICDVSLEIRLASDKQEGYDKDIRHTLLILCNLRDDE